MQEQTELQLQDVSADNAKVIATNYFNPVVWAQLKGMAETFKVSGALPQHYLNAAQIVVALQTGYEMGMKPMESIKALYPVNGTFNLYGAATVKRLRDHGWTIEYIEEDDTHIKATVSKGKEKFTDTFYYKDAEASGWTKNRDGSLKPGWKLGQNRKLKMRYGVLSAIIKTYIPEVLGSAVDIAEVAEDYEIIELPVKENTSAKPQTQAKVVEQIEEAETEETKDTPSKTDDVDKDKLRKLQREYFAIAKEAGVDSEEAKERIKAAHKVESLNDIRPEQLRAFNMAMRAKLATKKAEEEVKNDK